MKPKILLASIAITFALAIGIQPVHLMAIDHEATPTEFQITARAEFSNTRVEGITFDISGSGVAKTNVTTADEDVLFDGLDAGEYELSISIPGVSEFELAGGGETQIIELTEESPQELVTFPLQRKAPEVDDNLERISGFAFPDELTKVGSRTTKLSSLSPEALANVEAFTLDNPGMNRIVYRDGINLETFSEYQNIENISQYLDLESVGKVRFDTDSLEKFNKPATITMSKLRLVDFDDGTGEELPVALIHKDGKTSDEISNLKYEGNSLSFEVSGFSTYKVVPRVSLELPELNTNENERESSTITTDTTETKLVVSVDNLDSTIKVTNNGEIVNFASTADDNGVAEDTITLSEGINTFRVEVEIPNGESAQQVTKIDLLVEGKENNDASEFFGWSLIVVAILAAASGGGYYYFLQMKKRKGKNSPTKAIVQEKKETPKYEEGLLTDEEKEIYKTEGSQIPSTPKTSEETQPDKK